jgi:biopolymer transport protein ExbD
MALSLPNNPRDEEVDMAPMIDMVFLLLVFFMVSSHLQSEEYIEMKIPEAAAAKIPEDRSGRLVISIEYQPDSSVESRLFLGATPMEEDAMKEYMTTANERYMAGVGNGERLRLFLRAHVDEDHKEVRRVMQLAADAGIIDIIFASHEEVIPGGP